MVAIGEMAKSYLYQDSNGLITMKNIGAWYPEFQNALDSINSLKGHIQSISLGCNGNFYIDSDKGSKYCIEDEISDQVQNVARKNEARENEGWESDYTGRPFTTQFWKWKCSFGRRGAYIIIFSYPHGCVYDLKGGYRNLNDKLRTMKQNQCVRSSFVRSFRRS